MFGKNGRLHPAVWGLIAISAGAALFFTFFGITNSLWLDESYSVHVSTQGFQGIINELHHDTHPPLYYLLLAGWIRLFGISEAAVRGFSGLFYLCDVVAVYYLARTVYDRETGLLCSFLYMISPLSTATAQLTRMYSLLAFLSMLSMLLFFRLFVRGEKSRTMAALYVLVNVLGTFTHLWFFFLLTSHVLACALLLPRARTVALLKLLALSVIPYAVLWGPILLEQVRVNATSWLARPGLKEFALGLLGFFGLKVALVAYPLFLLLVLFRIRGRRIVRQSLAEIKAFVAERRSLVFLIFLGVALVLPFLISQIKPIFGPNRYTIIALPAFSVLLAAVLVRFADKRLLVGCCFLLLAGIGVAFAKHQSASQFCTDKNLTGYVVEHAGDGDLLVFNSLSRTTTDYYLRLMNPQKRFAEMTYPAELDQHVGWRNVEQMLRRRVELEREADEAIAWIKSQVADGRKRVWLFYLDDEISDILKRRLDANLSKVDEIGAACDEQRDEYKLFYRRILVYQGLPK
jgi:uncharacterized membrane protein